MHCVGRVRILVLRCHFAVGEGHGGQRGLLVRLLYPLLRFEQVRACVRACVFGCLVFLFRFWGLFWRGVRVCVVSCAVFLLCCAVLCLLCLLLPYFWLLCSALRRLASLCLVVALRRVAWLASLDDFFSPLSGAVLCVADVL